MTGSLSSSSRSPVELAEVGVGEVGAIEAAFAVEAFLEDLAHAIFVFPGDNFVRVGGEREDVVSVEARRADLVDVRMDLEVSDGDEGGARSRLEVDDGVADLLGLGLDDEVGHGPDIRAVAGDQRPAADIGLALGNTEVVEVGESDEGPTAGSADGAAFDGVLAGEEASVVEGGVRVVPFAVEDAAVRGEERALVGVVEVDVVWFEGRDLLEVLAAGAAEPDTQSAGQFAFDPDVAERDEDVFAGVGERDVEVADEAVVGVGEGAIDFASVSPIDVVDGGAAQVLDGAERFGFLGAGAVEGGCFHVASAEFREPGRRRKARSRRGRVDMPNEGAIRCEDNPVRGI